MITAFGRAFLSCWHPRVLLWSVLPVLLAAVAVAVLGRLYWEPALDGVRNAIDSFELSNLALRWLDEVGGRSLRTLLAPMVVVALSVPAVLLLSLLLVALLAVPALSQHVLRSRWPSLQLLRGASVVRTWAWTLGCAAVALLALVLSVPLWLVPPLVLLVPPLIWGWLIGRVMGYGVLATPASRQERRLLLQRHRWALWGMGLVCGYIASLPSLLWAAGTPVLIAAPLLAPVLAWVYAAVCVFAALWYAHFLLPRLQALRALAVPPGVPSAPGAAEPSTAPLVVPPLLAPTPPFPLPPPSLVLPSSKEP